MSTLDAGRGPRPGRPRERPGRPPLGRAQSSENAGSATIEPLTLRGTGLELTPGPRLTTLPSRCCR